jgi:hypothetical protein
MAKQQDQLLRPFVPRPLEIALTDAKQPKVEAEDWRADYPRHRHQNLPMD